MSRTPAVLVFTTLLTLCTFAAADAQTYSIWTTGLHLRSTHANLTISTGSPSAAARATTSAAGDFQWAYMPLTLPSNVRVVGVQVCYENSGSSFISQIRMTRMDTPTTSPIVMDDGTDLNVLSTGCHDATLNFGAIEVTAGLSLGLRLNFLNAGDYIEIGSIMILVEPIAVTASPDLPPLQRGAVGQNHPNPFNPTTTIPFVVYRDTHVVLRIYDAQGRVVRTLVEEPFAEGEHQVRWNGRDDQGREVASGAYYYRLVADGFTGSKTMILLK